MKALKRFVNALSSRGGAYIFLVLALCAAAFLRSATWTYSWIAELYPLGENFVPALLGVILACAAVSLILLLVHAFSGKNKEKKGLRVFRGIYLIFAVLSVIAFVYTAVLVFGLDSGISSANFSRGMQALQPELPLFGFVALLPLPLVFCESFLKTAKAAVAAALVAVLVIVPMQFDFSGVGELSAEALPALTLQSENLLEGASVKFESLKNGEKADAAALLSEGDDCWTPQDPARDPAEGNEDGNNSYVELQLAEVSTFNTAIIEEVGNQAQYFRLQAYIEDEWLTVYQSEKIQSMRLCSFDPVTTDRVRLSIDKFRDSETPVQIKSLRLYNEPVRAAEDFEATVYQRLDGDVPTEVLARGEDYVRNYARFYDVYSTVIVFAAVHWDEQGNMNFGDGGEEEFARQIAALKEIISYRSNPDHEVKLIVTALADGAWGDGHNGVNTYMAQYWESIADKIVAFVEKYDFDGVDIDWEYPQTADDWHVYDQFIARLDEGMRAGGEDRILSAALSAGTLGMTEETLDRLDQIQFMAYDGSDVDGYQSSLQQAQEGLKAFVDNGADLSKINIGIAAYGRPVNGSPYWAVWRELDEANYWDSKYYNVEEAGQIYEGTFCAPALAGDKTALALFSGAGGVMVFRIGCDKLMDDPNSVACGVENALNRYVENW